MHSYHSFIQQSRLNKLLMNLWFLKFKNSIYQTEQPVEGYTIFWSEVKNEIRWHIVDDWSFYYVVLEMEEKKNLSVKWFPFTHTQNRKKKVLFIIIFIHYNYGVSECCGWWQYKKKPRDKKKKRRGYYHLQIKFYRYIGNISRTFFSFIFW